MHEELIEEADDRLLAAQRDDLIVDYHVTACGDDLELIMTHRRGEDDEEIHRLAWEIFEACTEEAKRLKLYGAGQDLLTDAFSGNVKGMGPGVAEMAFEERAAEPIAVFMADKTSAGAWNLPHVDRAQAVPRTRPSVTAGRSRP
jgi:fructose 1,6-bisphosphate aldolase/phosphatase